MTINRRHFLKRAIGLSAAAAVFPAVGTGSPQTRPQMQLGLVTYLWGKDWDLPTLIKNCAATGIGGVELRTEHKHGVEPSLTSQQRREVRQRFADSPVTLIGYGSNAQFHEQDPARVQHNIELTKAYIRLMHDCGGTGVKVKPNGLPNDVPKEKTIVQIGKALSEIAAFGADYGQRIRLEVHGRETQRLPVIKAIMDVATHPNVGVCWNCNDTDLEAPGIEANFRMVRNRFGDTIHVREFNVGSYPYPQLMKLLTDTRYHGWILLECRTKPKDLVQALRDQRDQFEKLVAGSQVWP